MSAEGLITLERVMHDGTKVKALAGSNSFRREERIREHLKTAEEHVQQSPDDSEASCKEKVHKRVQKIIPERGKVLDDLLQFLSQKQMV
jgi:hypothetical protein